MELCKCRCGTAPLIDQMNPYDGRALYAYCPDCYDGAPDAGRQVLVEAYSMDELAEAWAEEMEERR